MRASLHSEIRGLMTTKVQALSGLSPWMHFGGLSECKRCVVPGKLLWCKTRLASASGFLLHHDIMPIASNCADSVVLLPAQRHQCTHPVQDWVITYRLLLAATCI